MTGPIPGSGLPQHRLMPDAGHWHWYRWQDWPADLLYASMRLRGAVFVVEQNCAFEDLDGLDPHGEHLCGTDPSGAVLAYSRLLPPGLKYPEAAIGRVVTAGAVRGFGWGRILMAQSIAGCRSRYPGQPIRIGAQQRLERFYTGFGFASQGKPYLEDGIWHIEMVLA